MWVRGFFETKGKGSAECRRGGVSVVFVTSSGGCAGGIARVPAQHNGSHKVERPLGSVDALDAACSPAAQTRSYEALYCREPRQRRAIRGRGRSRGGKDGGLARGQAASATVAWTATVALASVCARRGRMGGAGCSSAVVCTSMFVWEGAVVRVCDCEGRRRRRHGQADDAMRS